MSGCWVGGQEVSADRGLKIKLKTQVMGWEKDFTLEREIKCPGFI